MGEAPKRLVPASRAGRPDLSRATGGRISCYLTPLDDPFRRALGRELRRNESTGYLTESPGAPPWQLGHLR